MVVPAVATTAPVLLPAPSATSPTLVPAVAPLPIDTALVVPAVDTGPIATLSVPLAAESASVELAWKYLIPPPSTAPPIWFEDVAAPS